MTGTQQRFEMLIGMHITDEAGYQRYRQHMTPILESMGGFFRYDMRVSELLRGEAEEPFNRLFILSFPDEPTRDRFFSDDRYQAVRQEHFTGSVSSYTLIAQYHTRT
ncbi:MAG: DUF1330 domain-containing protein [Phycisphaerales bacterium]